MRIPSQRTEEQRAQAANVADWVDELLIIEPDERGIRRLALDQSGEYRPMKRSGLIDLTPAELAERIDWPQPDRSAADDRVR